LSFSYKDIQDYKITINNLLQYCCKGKVQINQMFIFKMTFKGFGKYINIVYLCKSHDRIDEIEILAIRKQ